MNKLKIWYAGLLLVFMVVMSVSCNKDEDVSLDFNITVPADWNFYVLANQGLVYTAERTAEDDQDSIREYMMIYKESLPGYDLLSYYNALHKIIVESDAFVSPIRVVDTTINGTDFKKMISREKGEFINALRDTTDLNLITTRFFFFEKNNGYNVALVSIDTLYPENKPVFDGIMSSFEYKQ